MAEYQQLTIAILLFVLLPLCHLAVSHQSVQNIIIYASIQKNIMCDIRTDNHLSHSK
jgi:hypothetical protein